MASDRSRRDLVRLAAAGGAGVLLAGTARADAPAVPAVSHYRSDKVLVRQLVVTFPKVDKPGRSYHILHKVDLPELRVGDIVQATAEVEVTGEHPYAIGIASFVSLGKTGDDGDGAYARGRFICYPNGSNLINFTHHHMAFTRAGSVEIDRVTAGLNTVFFVTYAASDARKAGDKVQVEGRSGHLSVTLIRKGEA